MAHSSDHDFVNELLTPLAAAIIVAILVGLQLLLLECVRIYRDNAFEDTPRSRVYWWLLGGMLACISLSVLLSAYSFARDIFLWPAALGFLAWVVAIEVLDATADQTEAPIEEQGLEDVLGPWRIHLQRSDQRAAA